MIIRVLLSLIMFMCTSSTWSMAEEDVIQIDGSPPVGVRKATRFYPLHKAILRPEFAQARLELPIAGELDLRQFYPFAVNAYIVSQYPHLDNPTGPGSSEDRTWWIGTRANSPNEVAMVTANNDGISGFVFAKDGPTVFGKVKGGTSHAVYRLADLQPGMWAPYSPNCGNDLVTRMNQAPHPVALPEYARLTGPVIAKLAIETDQELRARFFSDQAETDYIGTLIAAISAIYQRDTQIRLQVAWLRLWGTQDPWTATSTPTALDQVQAYWRDPTHGLTTVERASVHFISGKDLGGGIAYVGTICSLDYGFGVSAVSGAFNLAVPDLIWDPLVIAHELGHNFGSPHSHCYSPPLDQCYNRESGCYSGPVVATHGTIMSYCHLNSGGLGNMDLLFGGTAPTIRDGADRAVCLLPDGPVSTTTTTAASSTTTMQSTTTTIWSSTTTTQPSGECKKRFTPCIIRSECCSRKCAWRSRYGSRVCVR